MESITVASLCALIIMSAIWIHREHEFVRMYNAYEHVLDKVYKDNTEYCLNVLMNSDEYYELENIVYNDNNGELE